MNFTSFILICTHHLIIYSSILLSNFVVRRERVWWVVWKHESFFRCLENGDLRQMHTFIIVIINGSFEASKIQERESAHLKHCTNDDEYIKVNIHNGAHRKQCRARRIEAPKGDTHRDNVLIHFSILKNLFTLNSCVLNAKEPIYKLFA